VNVNNVESVAGIDFPAGRCTRVLVGPGAPMEARNFVIGHVTIYPGGCVPVHSHEQEEVYLIVSGKGVMRIGDEEHCIGPGDYVYIHPGSEHILKNTSNENMIMIFCYAPKSIAEHWKLEQEGKLK
jgi:mannose-6-phosphate isomerase-like protein (cupin superfamily)